jgi:3-hydroxybutyryl-CoA dehydrogenase
MEIAIIGTDPAVQQWGATAEASLRVLPVQTPEEAPEGALLIDLLFDGTEIRISQLLTHKGLVWINDVAGMLPAGLGFVRINGWYGFEKGPFIEAAGDESLRAAAGVFAAALGKTIEWLPDSPGFVTPRAISMIVNEAYHALSEGVSTKAEINTAMKLGTNYPHGPFEWAEIIGLKNIAQLLQEMAKVNARYEPNALLLKEAQ